MLNLHYRQTKRRIQPDGDYYVTAQIVALSPMLFGGRLVCDANVPNANEFETVGDHVKALKFALSRQENTVAFFSAHKSVLKTVERSIERAEEFAHSINKLLADYPDGSDVEYSESHEVFVLDYFPSPESEPEASKAPEPCQGPSDAPCVDPDALGAD